MMKGEEKECAEAEKSHGSFRISFFNLDSKEKKERTAIIITTRKRKNSECLLGLMEISTSVQAIV